MAHIKVQIRKLWQTRQYESEEITLAYEEDVPPEDIENRMAKKTQRREDAVAELASSAYISLANAACAAMERSLARPDPREKKADASAEDVPATQRLGPPQGQLPKPLLARPPMRRP